MSSAELVRDRWRFQVRCSPWGLVVAAAAIATAVAWRSRLDLPSERTAVAIVTTVALSLASGEAMAELSTPTPERRWRRRARAIGAIALPSVATWLAVSVAAAAYAATAAPDRWSVLEWSAIAATQLAVGAVAAGPGRNDIGLGPGLAVAVGWAAVLWMPRLSEWMVPIPAHAARWWVVAAVALALVVAAGRDPAARGAR